MSTISKAQRAWLIMALSAFIAASGVAGHLTGKHVAELRVKRAQAFYKTLEKLIDP